MLFQVGIKLETSSNERLYFIFFMYYLWKTFKRLAITQIKNNHF